MSRDWGSPPSSAITQLMKKIIYDGDIISPEEHILIHRRIGDIMEMGERVVRDLCTDHPRLKGTCYHDMPVRGQFNYIPNRSIGNLYVVAQRLKAKSIIDLGSGLGLGLSAINMIQRDLHPTKHISISGIEIHEPLCKAAERIFGIRTKHKNLLFLEKEDIEAYDILYAYEPMNEYKVAEAFINRLAPLLHEGQCIAIVSTGNMLRLLRAHPNVQELKVKSPIPLFIKK